LQLLEILPATAPDITIVHAGTRQIYGRPRYVPVDEDHPLRPADVNGVNKMAGEAYHLLFRDVYGIKSRSLRLTNIYGPGMRIKDARQNFVGIWLRRRSSASRSRCGAASSAATSSTSTTPSRLPVRRDQSGNRGAGAQCRRRCAVQPRGARRKLVRVNGGGHYENREFPVERKRIDIGDFITDDRPLPGVNRWKPRVALGRWARPFARLLPGAIIALYWSLRADGRSAKNAFVTTLRMLLTLTRY
jgi:hypothetical protein